MKQWTRPKLVDEEAVVEQNIFAVRSFEEWAATKTLAVERCGFAYSVLLGQPFQERTPELLDRLAF